MGKGGALGGPSGLMAEQQTAADRRALRQEYRRLYADAVEGKEQLEDAGSGVLHVMLDKVESLRDKVEKPREHAVDADVFCHLTECGLTMVSRGHAARQGRTPAAFIMTLRQLYGGESGASARATDPEVMGWAALGAAAAAFHAPAPGAGCMLGPLDVHAKARAAAQRRRRAAEPEAALVRAQELAAKDLGAEQDKQETDRNMLVMWDCLQTAGGAASFAALVLNHRSFSQTVENIFTLSFLVRDRRVSMHRDDAAGLTVKAAPKPSGAAAPSAAAAAPAVQLMLSFGMRDFELMRAAVQPRDCIMPHRAPKHHGGSSPPGGQQQRAPGGRRRRGEEAAEVEEGAGSGEEEEGEEEEQPAAPQSKRSRRGSR